MTHRGCPNCRLRFAPAVAAFLVSCPVCGEPAHGIANPELALGFRLFTPGDIPQPGFIPQPLPEAVAVAIPVPEPNGAGS